ncbi:hypothetical protein PENSPDRAFT_18210 [Peniophora sp. CONT]|nr:hypothetical protein PENSPDRAFT_18210 [Peniophora sp. CONT]
MSKVIKQLWGKLRVARNRLEAVESHCKMAAMELGALKKKENSKKQTDTGTIRYLARVLNDEEGLEILLQDKLKSDEKEAHKAAQDVRKEERADAQAKRRYNGARALVITTSLASAREEQLQDIAWSLGLSDIGKCEILRDRIKTFIHEPDNKHFLDSPQYAPLYPGRGGRKGKSRAVTGGGEQNASAGPSTLPSKKTSKRKSRQSGEPAAQSSGPADPQLLPPSANDNTTQLDSEHGGPRAARPHASGDWAQLDYGARAGPSLQLPPPSTPSRPAYQYQEAPPFAQSPGFNSPYIDSRFGPHDMYDTPTRAGSSSRIDPRYPPPDSPVYWHHAPSPAFHNTSGHNTPYRDARQFEPGYGTPMPRALWPTHEQSYSIPPIPPPYDTRMAPDSYRPPPNDFVLPPPAKRQHRS